MLSGFYTIASGILSQQRNMDVIGNNLVNSQTPGYRADRMVISSFEEELAIRQTAYGDTQIGKSAPIAYVSGSLPIFDHGDIKATERTFDIALNGEGYFNVEGTDGQTYLTRNGQFDVNAEGVLILPGLGVVQGEDGPMTVGGSEFKVDEAGLVYNQNGEAVGKFLLTEPEEGTTLVKQKNGMYQPAVLPALNNLAAGIQPEPQPQTRQVADTAFVQGSLELSNVNMSQELTTYMEVQRAFQSCSSALQILDGMSRKSVSQIAAI